MKIQHTASAAPYTILVTFTWGDSSVARYCRWDDDLTVGGSVHTSVPNLSARLSGHMDGGTAPEQCEVQMPSTLPPMTTALLPSKHPEIRVKIEEFSPGTSDSARVLFYGKVYSIRRPRSGMCRVSLRGLKARLAEARVGGQALTTCIHTYGDADCGKDVDALTLNLTVTSVNTGGVQNRIQGTLTGSPDMDNEIWARGYVRKDKNPITIRSVVSEGSNPNPTVTLDLRQQAPASWVGQVVSLIPGCSKTIEACRARGREISFMGLGYKMLPYNPGFYDAPE